MALSPTLTDTPTELKSYIISLRIGSDTTLTHEVLQCGDWRPTRSHEGFGIQC